MFRVVNLFLEVLNRCGLFKGSSLGQSIRSQFTGDIGSSIGTLCLSLSVLGLGVLGVLTLGILGLGVLGLGVLGLGILGLGVLGVLDLGILLRRQGLGVLALGGGLSNLLDLVLALVSTLLHVLSLTLFESGIGLRETVAIFVLKTIEKVSTFHGRSEVDGGDAVGEERACRRCVEVKSHLIIILDRK